MKEGSVGGRGGGGGGYVGNKFYCFVSTRFYVRVASYNSKIYFSGTSGLYVPALIVSPYLLLYYLLPQNTVGKEKHFPSLSVSTVKYYVVVFYYTLLIDLPSSNSN